jgi:predicted Ser/Thr protein kinase
MEPLTRDDPAQIAGYRLHARLGAGGMGRVYLAYTPGGRPVALKVVRTELGDQEDFRIRFSHEVEAAQRVHGLYTAQLLDADPAAVPPWLVTAYVPGPSLQQAVTEHGPMPAETVFGLIGGMAEALLVIHSVGVVHRDLKPSNVILAPDGPRVIDFGIARALEATAITRSGHIVGSPQFMAPEQVLGLPVAPAIDVFALGAVAFYAATGRTPFGDGDPQAILYRVRHEPADLTRCPAELRPLIERCLDKDAAARPEPAEIIDSCRARLGASTAELGRSWLPLAVAAGMGRHAAPPSPAAPPPPAGPPPPVTPVLPAAPTAEDATLASGTEGGQPAPGGRRIPRAAIVIAAAAVAAAVIIAVVLLPGTKAPSGGIHHPTADGTRLRTSHASHDASPPATATPPPTASASGDQCLPGTWSATLALFADTGTIEGQSDVIFTGGAGFTESFTSSGAITRDWNHSAPYVAQIAGNTWSLVVRGNATARYTATNGHLAFSDVSGSIALTLYKDGAYNNSGLSATSLPSTRYSCSGSLLQVHASNGGVSTFTRVQSAPPTTKPIGS